MIVLKKGNGLLVSLLLSSIFETIDSRQSDLANIFRTPRDRSQINFDHLEIIERNNFQLPETTTTIPGSDLVPTEKEISSNVANSQVFIRFGGDDSHIMKIPPQCRSHHEMNPLQDFDHPAKFGHPQYYHPYPPPVPYTFPNYYFCNYGPKDHELTPQLREYLIRHPEFLSGPYPSRRQDQVFIWGRPLKKEDLAVPALHAVTAKIVAKEKEGRSQVNATLKVEEERVKNLNEVEKEKEEKGIKSVSVHNLILPTESDQHHKKHHKKKHQKKYKANTIDFQDLERLLDQALTALANSTQDIPECETEIQQSIESKETKCPTKVDDIVALIVEVPNAVDESPISIPAPRLSHIGLDLGSLKGTNQFPLKAVLNFDFPQGVTQHLPIINTKSVLPQGPSWTLSPYQGAFSQYFFPEGNVVVRRLKEDEGNKQLKIVPNVEMVVETAPVPQEVFCRKCGHRHGGGNFCPSCGSPVKHRTVARGCEKDTKI